jgi:hypothetical protein
MIEFVLQTGFNLISGFATGLFATNLNADNLIFSQENNKRQTPNTILSSLNSQTLVEDSGTATNTNFFTIYNTVGDLYFLEEKSKVKGYLSQEININDLQTKNILFDLRSGQKMAIGTGFSTTGMQNNLLSNIQIDMPLFSANLSSLDFYLNGQKIYSGVNEGYSIINDTGFLYNLNITGKLFASPKNNNFLYQTGNNYDFSGSFIEGQNNIYVNGMEEHPISWKELNSSVKSIKTGVSAKINYRTGTTYGYAL